MGAAPLICSGKAVEPEPRELPRVGETRLPSSLSPLAALQVRRRKRRQPANNNTKNGGNSGKTAAAGRTKRFGIKRVKRADSIEKSTACLGEAGGGGGGNGGKEDGGKREGEDGTVDILRHHHIVPVVMKKYDVKELLGTGTFSHIFHVESKYSKDQLALKVVKRSTSPAESGNSCDKEIEILTLCDHQNIMKLHDVVRSLNTVYMVMDLALGGDLYERLTDKGCFEEEKGLNLLRMVSNGLSYLHGLDISHRDLKLENLLFKDNSESSPILITDFGLAHYNSVPITNGCGQKRKNNNMMSTTCGTAEYLSPEMLRGDEYCNKVDMWSLGVVGYTVLGGSMPFTEGKAGRGGRAELYQNIMDGNYSFSDQVHYSSGLCVWEVALEAYHII